MGNWPSVISDEGSVESEGSQSDNPLDSSDQEDAVDLCGSEKSFFSEEEVLPVIDSDDDGARDDDVLILDPQDVLWMDEGIEFAVDEVDGSRYEMAEFHPTTVDGIDVSARFPDLPQPQSNQERSYSSTDDNDDDDDDDDIDDEEDDDDQDYHRRRRDIYSAVNADDEDELSSIPLPPPSSPYEVALSEQLQGCSSSLNADYADTLRESIVPVESYAEECSAPERVVAWEIDVSDMTGSKKPSKKKPPNKLSKAKASKSSSKISLDSAYIPPSVSTTPELLAQRKHLDQKRWFCMSRPQYSKSCGLSSLVSCWNYLFSTIGEGTMPPITQEQALTVLGFQPPFGEIRFGPFTGNATLMRWFKRLNDHYGVRGRAYFQYKPHGRSRTVGRTSTEGLHLLRQGLKDPNMAFIYHCYNHYFCPMGYEDVPLKAVDAYRDPLNQDEVESWILIGDPSRKHPGIHCFKWEDISIDLNCQSPDYLNIRKLQLGVQQRRTKKTGGNLHCIMAFCRSAGFLTGSAKAKKEGGAMKESSGPSGSNKPSLVRAPGRKVGKSKSEGMVGSTAPGDSMPCLQTGKVDNADDIIKHVASDSLSCNQRGEVQSSRTEVIKRTGSKPQGRRRRTKASCGKHDEEKEMRGKGSESKKKVVPKKNNKKQKSSTVVNRQDDVPVSSPQDPFKEGLNPLQDDYASNLHRPQSSSFVSKRSLDDLDNFTKNLFNDFKPGLGHVLRAEVQAMRAEPVRDRDGPGVEPSELAKHLIDQYLLSILDSIDKRRDNTARYRRMLYHFLDLCETNIH